MAVPLPAESPPSSMTATEPAHPSMVMVAVVAPLTRGVTSSPRIDHRRLTLAGSTSRVSGSSIAATSGEKTPVTAPVATFVNVTLMFPTSCSASAPNPSGNSSPVSPKRPSGTGDTIMSSRGSPGLEAFSTTGVSSANSVQLPLNVAGVTSGGSGALGPATCSAFAVESPLSSIVSPHATPLTVTLTVVAPFTRGSASSPRIDHRRLTFC